MPKAYPYEVRERFFALVCGGESLQAAAVGAGVSWEAGRLWWRASGLVEPSMRRGRAGGLVGSAPASFPGAAAGEQPRRRRALSSEDRAVIAVLLRQGLSYAGIGEAIGRDRSVIWREVARNRGPDGSYWAPVAHRGAHERRRRPKEFKLAADPGLCARITDWMDAGWSPGLIATVLRRDHPGASAEEKMARVSHETIYQALYVQTRGQLRQDLHRQLSLRRSARKPRGGRRQSTGPYREAFRISQRPAEAADRAVPGHWEGDLIIGAANTSAVGTLVERSTRFTILLHLPGQHDADSVAEAMIAQMRTLPDHLRRSLTWDRGTELAAYRRIQLDLDMPVYFCDPHSPWQRGTNENTNRLLRFWLTKGSELSIHTAADLDRIAATLNQRPRPTLNLKTPAQALAELLANPAAA
ncbi:IS30 family transposase [Kribbella sp. NBC_01484]|uniref:IS30 family transposase n=1 Tax=Kribbella sp. NBC_01484 TaxID=2903579 RepID=UPI002E348739|nr:IS30 family transposase [Kribbella sp. NBC_01484]